MDWKAIQKQLERFKYPLLILLLGLFLLLMPSEKQRERTDGSDTGETLEQVLVCTDGVGRVRVIVSEKGAVVVCDGAEKAGVRLDILHAVASYTGFGSDKITVLKMSD